MNLLGTCFRSIHSWLQNRNFNILSIMSSSTHPYPQRHVAKSIVLARASRSRVGVWRIAEPRVQPRFSPLTQALERLRDLVSRNSPEPHLSRTVCRRSREHRMHSNQTKNFGIFLAAKNRKNRLFKPDFLRARNRWDVSVIPRTVFVPSCTHPARSAGLAGNTGRGIGTNVNSRKSSKNHFGNCVEKVPVFTI